MKDKVLQTIKRLISVTVHYKEYIIYISASFAILYLCYHSFLVCFLSVPIGIIIQRHFMKKKKRSKKKIRGQFADFLDLFSSMLISGNSINRSIRESLSGLNRMYDGFGEKERPIPNELRRVINEMNMGTSVAVAFDKMAERLQVREISDFTYAFAVMCRKGGNISELAGNTASMLSQQLKSEEEIKVMTSEIRLSQRILYCMFPLLLGALNLTVPEYTQPLYSTIGGRIIMTAVIGAVIASWLISEKMTEINY